MWEYAVLHEHGKHWMVFQGEGTGKVHLELKFKKPLIITKGDLVGDVLKGAKIVSDDTLHVMCVSEKWDAEAPLFEPKGMNKSHALYKTFVVSSKKREKKIAEFYGSLVKHAKWLSTGWAVPIYKANTATQVLNKAGLDGWELLGNVPGGTNRLLRKKL